MSDIILHHYPSSPFAEKARMMLGFKKLAWKSVTIPVIMPKPNLTALTGGYRRTPVMQIGADVYCDTALIADVLERIQPSPTLYPPATEGESRTLAQWADSVLFWTMITYVFQPAGMQDVMGRFTPEQLKAFGADRAALRGNAPRLSLAEATAALTEYLRRLEHMLADERPYLLGRQPGIADFSVYHCLWYLQNARSVAGILDASPRLVKWIARMAEIGHGTPEPLSEQQALEIARNSSAAPADLPFVDIHGAAPGDRVSIMPSDYGLDPVEGELVIASATELALRRHDPQAGSVVVHFPRIGFQMKKLG
jgi:glutathione S-transferase